MRVKKFEAKNMKDALQMVKNELGPDAVILAARDNRKSFGLGGEASVEITAAVSESTLQKKKFVESRMTVKDRAKFQGSNARTQRDIISHVVDGRTRDSEAKSAAAAPVHRPTTRSYIDIPDEEIAPTPRRKAAMEQARGRNVRELLNDFNREFNDTDENDEQWETKSTRQLVREHLREPARAKAAAPQRRQVEESFDDDYEEQAPAPAPSAEAAMARLRNAARAAVKSVEQEQGRKAAPAPQKEVPSQGALEMHAPAREHEINTLKSEIDRLQKMIEGFQKMPQTFATLHPGADYGMPFELSFMFEKLTNAGVTIDQTVDLLQLAMKEIDPIQIKKRPIVDAWVARYILTHVQTSPAPFAGRVHQFVGGAGSGKTATLVKMASHLVVKEKRKVAILSSDAYKVGAVDQMKIYCQILNVPFAVVRNRRDWEWVMSQLQGVDHILCDTPGFQLRDLDEIQTLKSLLAPPEAQAATHYCVSATTKDGDAFETARRYKVTEMNDMIVTNLDQSVQHGIIYNLHAKTGTRLHSFGTGNRIPEDFELATKERVLDLIFKLTKLRKENK